MVNSDADIKDLTHVGDGSKELTITTTLRGKQQTNTYKGRDTLFENGTYAYYVLNPEEKPDFYKEVTVGEDGNFKFSETKFQNGKSVKKSDATAEITTKTTRGDYQINVSGLDESVTNSSIYEVILETKDGKSYGLRHLENIWLRKRAWNLHRIYKREPWRRCQAWSRTRISWERPSIRSHTSQAQALMRSTRTFMYR